MTQVPRAAVPGMAEGLEHASCIGLNGNENIFVAPKLCGLG